MRVILTAFPQTSAKITLLKTGSLTHLFRDGQRILITEVPQQLENAPVGEVSGQGQWLSMEPALASFFTESRVINAAGGQDGLRTWISRLPECQDTKGDHVQNLTTAQTKDGGAIRLCHACDNRHYLRGYRDLSDIASRNRAEWIVDYARMNLRLNAGHQLTLPELFCWAVINGVTDAMPVSVIRRFYPLPEDDDLSGTLKESDIIPWALSPRQLVAKKAREGMAAAYPAGRAGCGAVRHCRSQYSQTEPDAELQPVLRLKPDADPPAGYMRKPKMIRLALPEYTQWVKKQSCCGCGKAADDPHHIIGHGFGGTGTKACDLMVIPLCRVCHEELHRNTKEWEAQHGSQLLWLAITLNRASGIGAIARA